MTEANKLQSNMGALGGFPSVGDRWIIMQQEGNEWPYNQTRQTSVNGTQRKDDD